MYECDDSSDLMMITTKYNNVNNLLNIIQNVYNDYMVKIVPALLINVLCLDFIS